MKMIHVVTLLLVLIGGINWTLFGLMGLNLVTSIFGTGVLATLVYLLITGATVYLVMPMFTKTVTAHA